MNYDIYICKNDNSVIYQLPVIPEKLPELSKAISNEEFETWWNGRYNFIEKPGLLEFTLQCWLPRKGRTYNFLKSTITADDVIPLIETARDNAEPIRIIICCDDGTLYVNDSFCIESFSYYVNFEGDYDYSLSVKQYRFAEAEIKATAATDVGWKHDATGWWYVYDENGSYYRDCWEYIGEAWYSFDFDGYARQSTWLQDGGYWYWLKDDCVMARNEWVKVSGKSYYFGDLGGMYTNSYTPDGYWVGSDGAWIQ